MARKVADGFLFSGWRCAPTGDDRIFDVEQVSDLALVVKKWGRRSCSIFGYFPKFGGWSGEQGVLGMTFHHNNAQNSFYVNYADALALLPAMPPFRLPSKITPSELKNRSGCRGWS